MKIHEIEDKGDCFGCELFRPSLKCKRYNRNEACPCTNCIGKVMDCKRGGRLATNDCDKWLDWFRDLVWKPQ